MKTFSNFILEAAGQGFAQMSDYDFERWVKANPAAADKARKIRDKFKQTYQKAQTGQKAPPKSPEPPKGPQTTPSDSRRQQTSAPKPPQPPSTGGMPKTGVGARLRSLAGPALNVGLSGYEIAQKTKERQDKGERLRTAIPKSAAEVGGGLAGMRAGATLAAKLPTGPSPIAKGAATLVGGALGYAAGEKGASDIIKKFERPSQSDIDTQIKRAKERRVQKQVPQIRQQAAKTGAYGAEKGSAIKGIGGPMKVDTKAGTITTGGKTAQLPKTMLLPGGRLGDLAYKGGKPVYLARGDVSKRVVPDQDLLSKLSRFTGIGGGREKFAAKVAATKQREIQQGMKGALQYRKQLGITGSGVSKPPAAKPPSAKSAQAYAASKGKYYSSTTGKTYANYAAALKDPAVKAASKK